jgi:hypothetical protein
MYALTIQNPQMEALAREVFKNPLIEQDADFLAFLAAQKIKQDLRESVGQMEKGDLLESKAVYASLYNELGL